jgi:hypothetical protein
MHPELALELDWKEWEEKWRKKPRKMEGVMTAPKGSFIKTKASRATKTAITVSGTASTAAPTT